MESTVNSSNYMLNLHLQYSNVISLFDSTVTKLPLQKHGFKTFHPYPDTQKFHYFSTHVWRLFTAVIYVD